MGFLMLLILPTDEDSATNSETTTKTNCCQALFWRELEMRVRCDYCSYEWEYKGRMLLASCPSCARKVKTDTSLAAAGVFGAPASLEDRSDNQQTPTYSEEVEKIVAQANLPFGKRQLAQRMILEAARAICTVLKEDSDR
jgi:hypothetical protein